jgi:thiamine pyrophosphokinase
MNNQRICAIFAGGPEAGSPCLPVPEGAYILCADSGLRLAERLSLTPDLVLGDFDSLGAVPETLPHMTVQVEKDDTDTMLAARVALEKGFRDIRIYGAFGGRLDHTLANLQTLEFLRNAGADAVLIGTGNLAFLMQSGENRRIPRRDGWTLSLFAWSPECTDVSASGVFYPLEHGTLTRAFPLGVSNHITAEAAEITCGSGTLLVICSRL